MILPVQTMIPEKKTVTAPLTHRFFIAAMATWLFANLAAGGTISARAEVIDRIIAEVNGDIITLSDMESEGQLLFDRIAAEASMDDRQLALDAAWDQVLDSLIDQALITQEAAKNNIVASEAEVDAAFQQMVAASGVSEDEFFTQLAIRGLSESLYRKNLRTQILQNKLINREVLSKIVITEEQVLDYYESQFTSTVDDGGYYLLQIGINWDVLTAGGDGGEAAARRQARQRAEQAHALAMGGEDFRELARQYSDLPSAEDGGDIGVFQKDELAPFMLQAIEPLRPGEVSAIIETPVGFQFFKLLSSKTGGIVQQAPYSEVKEEIRERLYRQEVERQFDLWLTEIKGKAYIKIL
jgi:peptidyl-prolyl cis-trans isomerase SurA